MRLFGHQACAWRSTDEFEQEKQHAEYLRMTSAVIQDLLRYRQGAVPIVNGCGLLVRIRTTKKPALRACLSEVRRQHRRLCINNLYN